MSDISGTPMSSHSSRDIIRETKKLKIDLLEYEGDYISGQKDLNTTLDRTEELYNAAIKSTDTTASKILQDSGLLELQTKIAKHCVKSYTVDTLVFNPREFSIKVRNFFCPRFIDGNDRTPHRVEPLHKVWSKLGDESKAIMYTVPNFSFLYGTFDAEKIEAPKRQRKQIVKDKIGAQTKPEKVDPNATSKQQDVTLLRSSRILSLFKKAIKRKKINQICFYEFVTDPGSFTRTIENIFHVSLLVKEGMLAISLDDQNTPWLRLLNETENKQWDTTKVQQTIVSLTMEDWEDIVKTLQLEKPLIRPQNEGVESGREGNV